ncbi:hypothetical protein MTO96_022862 [Rhipicephalus appendiculatus]
MARPRCLFLGLAALAFTFAAVAKAANRAYNSDPKLWALLVASSKGYDNYRHQANIYHAYHVLHKHGIPNQRIVVMMYDDIANSSSNPYRGTVVNRPSGTDVYKGVPKDYTGDLVSPQNFLDILQGKKVKGGSGKVIASEATDHIFVNVVGLGAPGLIAFHNGTLHARPFVNVIKRMKTERKFREDGDLCGRQRIRFHVRRPPPQRCQRLRYDLGQPSRACVRLLLRCIQKDVRGQRVQRQLDGTF